ncbi:MAG TPA: ATP-binding protein [Polyangia bacterium]|jgi:two-component system sensor histidine kinase RegB
MSAPAADPHGINFSWLVKLRWGAVAGQIVTVLAVSRGLHVLLPMGALLAVIAVEALSNVGCALVVMGGRPPREWWLVAVMAFDTLVLTALLSLSGGPFNPFSFLYLVQIALAAVVLRARFTWALVGLAMACSAVLFAVHRDLPLSHAQHMDLHVRGMWVAFAVAAGFIVYFLMRVTRALGERESDLQAAHHQAARQERLASLATLAAGAAHELATPLSTIALVAKELSRHLEARGADRETVEDARLIREQVERCREILEQMALDAGQSAGEGPVDVQVDDVVARSLRGLAEAPAIRVAVAPALLHAKVRLPPRALAQALHGILKNAQDASRAGDEVELSAAEEGGWLSFVVGDRGSGMPPEVLARAGEPFYTTKPPGRGMGLGLFLSRTLMERLGGRLRVESNAGRGTTVTLALPLG